MDQLDQEHYDEKSMLVKLCIQDGGVINSNELMRFHPFFSQITLKAAKTILRYSQLT